MNGGLHNQWKNEGFGSVQHYKWGVFIQQSVQRELIG